MPRPKLSAAEPKVPPMTVDQRRDEEPEEVEGQHQREQQMPAPTEREIVTGWDRDPAGKMRHDQPRRIGIGAELPPI